MRASQATFPDDRAISPYTRSCLPRIRKNHALDVLDIPSGFGRHSLFLAGLGHRVVSVDVDEKRLVHAAVIWDHEQRTSGTLAHVVADARHDLPFPADAFDLVLVVHYVSDRIIEAVCPLIRRGGLLLYETFGAQGDNWKDLPLAGATASRLRDFEILDLRERPVQRSACVAVTVKMLARKL